jgi:peptidoglycan/LPS O-acetylase OafA/YrhL
MTATAPSTFRPDINGLRAWAVVLVVLFHFGVPGLAGGFVGVDVFFVISGFLMMQIIANGLERNGFSVLSFYLARARRIIPALLVLCASLLVAGWAFLPAIHYRMLANHVISAVVFFSNVKFWREAGYFDAASHEKWLLHTWSLSVEWQFYLVLPLVLWAAYRLWESRGIVAATVIGLSASLLACVLMTPTNPTAAFFLLPFRAWEMFTGAAVYLFARPALRQAKAIELTGLALIVGAAVLFDGSSSWPGWRAAIPVVGAAMMLAAARQGSALTAPAPLQWIGERSYSIYLWHWPLVVALGYLGLQGNPAAVVVGLVLTFLVGHLSYRLVEVPTRRGLTRYSLWPALIGIGAAAAIVAAPAVGISVMGGLKNRLPAEVEALFSHEPIQTTRTTECLSGDPKATKSCTVGTGTLGAIVIGDSHAARIVQAVHKALGDPSRYVLDWSLTSCPTVRGVKKVIPVTDCGAFLEAALAKQEALPKDAPIIIMNRLTYYAFGRNEPDPSGEPVPSIYFEKQVDQPTPEFLAELKTRLVDTACAFGKTRPVYMVRPTPEMGRDVPHALWLARVRGLDPNITVPEQEYRARHKFFVDAQDAAHEKCGVQILDPTPHLCHSGQCSGADHGRALFADDDHLSALGADLLVPMFAKALRSGSPRASYPGP